MDFNPDKGSDCRLETDLKKSVISDQGRWKGGRGSEEAWICDLFDRFPDREDQSSVHERHDDVSVVLLWWNKWEKILTPSRERKVTVH